MKDLATVIIISLVLSFGLVIIHIIMTPLLSGIANSDVISQNNMSVQALQNTQSNAINRLDYVFLVIFIGLFIVCLIVSYFISGIPLFTFIYFIILIFMCMTSAIFSYIWTKFEIAPELTLTIQNNFPITNYIMENFLVFTIILGFLSMIVMYAKPQQI